MFFLPEGTQDFLQWTHGNLWRGRLFTLYSTSRCPNLPPNRAKYLGFGLAKKNFMVEITYQHQVVFVGWTSCSFNFFFLKFCICSLGSGSECLETRKILWKVDCTRWFKVTFSSPSWRSLSHLKGSLNHPKKGQFGLWIFPPSRSSLLCIGPCRPTTARRSRRGRRPRSVMSLEVLVVFLVESKYHLESYHPSEIIKFTSWRVIKQQMVPY